MSRVHTIDGVDVTDTVEFGTLTDLTTAARGGERGGGKVTVTDPTGTLNLRGWHSYTCDETLCVGRPRLFTGRIGGKEIKRGPEGPIGPGRVWECDLEDLNVLAHQRPTYGTGGKRPEEMGLDRVAWLLTTAAVGGSFVDTGYVVDTFDRLFDPADYRTNYPDEILDDIVGIRGRDWFIFWDYDALAAALFYSFREHVILTSSLKISNVEGDADYETVFPPGSTSSGDDAGISRQHDDVYSGVLMVTSAGNFFVGDRASTVSTFFHDAPESRVAIVDNSRIGKRSTALAMGEQFLDAHASEKDTITIPIVLPARLVNYIAAGERILVKLEHEPGYEDDYAPIRIATRTISEAGLGEDGEPQYDVVIKCTNSAPANNSGVGAPPPGVFPRPPSAGPRIVQQVSGSGNIHFANLPTAGNTLIYAASARSSGFGSWTYTGQGYTLSPEGLTVEPDVTANVGVVWKVADGTEDEYLDGATSTVPGLECQGTWYELEGAWSPDTHDSRTATSSTLSTPNISAAANSFNVAVGCIGHGGAWDSVAASMSFTPASGWTEDLDHYNDGGGAPNATTMHRIQTGAGSISAGAAFVDVPGLSAVDYDWAMQIVSFVTTGLESEPPLPGQWVYGELVTLVAGAGTTEFPFADGSLHVRYDIVDQTPAIVSYDGATGDFQMPSDPPLGTQVFVDYQGR